MADELGRICKDAKVIIRQHMFVGTEENHENLSQDSRRHFRDSNLVPTEVQTTLCHNVSLLDAGCVVADEQCWSLLQPLMN
jgi:hypothetical protein